MSNESDRRNFVPNETTLVMMTDTILENAIRKLQYEGFLKLPVEKGLDLFQEINRLSSQGLRPGTTPELVMPAYTPA